MADSGALHVALLDDHEVVRSGLARILAGCPRLTVCGEASNAVEAVDLARNRRPEIFVVDITLPGENGIVATERILAVSPGTRVVVLTMHEDVSYLRAAFAAGARGYLLKRTASTEIVSAVLAVADDGEYVDPGMGAALVRHDPPDEDLSLNLSPREVEVLRLLAHGYTNKELAKTLHISARTAETHRARIQQKLGVKSRAELASIARTAGLTD